VTRYTDLWLAFGAAVVTVYVVWRIKRSSYGRAMFAQRGDRWAANSVGVSVLRPRLQAFVISAFFTAVAGSLYAHFLGSFSPNAFYFDMTFEVVTMLVVGGMGSVSGSVIGATPPMVGWVAGGGRLDDPRAWIIAFFFFIWQVPHFWLLLLKFGKEYEKAGFPSITSIYTDKQIKNTTFIWTMATAVTALMLPVFGIVNSAVMGAGLLVAVIWLVFVFSKLVRPTEEKFNARYYFMKINYFVLFIIIFLSVDSLI